MSSEIQRIAAWIDPAGLVVPSDNFDLVVAVVVAVVDKLVVAVVVDKLVVAVVVDKLVVAVVDKLVVVVDKLVVAVVVEKLMGTYFQRTYYNLILCHLVDQ